MPINVGDAAGEAAGLECLAGKLGDPDHAGDLPAAAVARIGGRALQSVTNSWPISCGTVPSALKLPTNSVPNPEPCRKI